MGDHHKAMKRENMTKVMISLAAGHTTRKALVSDTGLSENVIKRTLSMLIASGSVRETVKPRAGRAGVYALIEKAE